jgi:hypothetical protein
MTKHTLSRPAAAIAIWTAEEILSDGSKVFNVIIESGNGNAVALHAVTESDAGSLTARLKLAITGHTVDSLEG